MNVRMTPEDAIRIRNYINGTDINTSHIHSEPDILPEKDIKLLTIM